VKEATVAKVIAMGIETSGYAAHVLVEVEMSAVPIEYHFHCSPDGRASLMSALRGGSLTRWRDGYAAARRAAVGATAAKRAAYEAWRARMGLK
jgi:hypothetical protein